MEARLAALYELGQKLILVREPQQVVEAVLDIAARALDLQDSDFLLVDEPRGELYVAARRGGMEQAGTMRLRLDGDRGITVAAARHGTPVYVADVRQDPRYVFTGFPAISELSIPVQFHGRVLGVLNVESTRPDAFSQADQELLCILASQAALALENARLHTEERRQAEEMTLLEGLARRISASLDLQETLEAVVAGAAELIPCNLAEVSLWDAQAEMLTLLALKCDADRTYPVGQAFPPGEGYTGWMVRHQKPLLVPDVDHCDIIRPHLLPGEQPFRAYAGVPLLAGETLVGTLVLVSNEAGAFGTDDLRLLQALASHAATAIQHARLYEQVRQHNRELSALYAVAEVVNRPLELHDLLQLALDRVVHVTETQIGVVRLLDEEGDELLIAAVSGLEPEDVLALENLHLGERGTERLHQFRRPMVVQQDLSLDPRFSSASNRIRGLRTFVTVPMRVKDKPVGTLGVSSRHERHFTEEDLDLLVAIGHQLAAAVAHAHLRQEALAAERLAAVGRVAASVAHDLRSPLGGILRSAEFLARPELSSGTRQKLSQAVVSLARRLINSTQEILDYVRGEKLPLKRTPCSLPEFLDDVLAVLEVDFGDRGIEVVTDCRYRGVVVMDADRIAQVVYNLAANARDAMPEGGTFTVASRQAGTQIELRFTDTGPGVPDEFKERIFEPFFSLGKRAGAGLGLSIARRIIEEHGGELWLESRERPGATFVASLPV